MTTNDTAPHANGVADETATAVLTTTPATDSDAPAAEAEAAAPAEAPAPTFDDLGMHPDIKQALDDMGYLKPTPVQTAVFKPVSEGKDLLVQSRTGTGKTTAFGLPTLNKLVPTHRAPQALILAPTRELAIQVARELTQIGKHRGIVVEPIYGGAPIGKQITNLQNGVHVIVGTPGRVLDHIGRRTLDTKAISTFILDECDEMLSMGFLEDIERVVSHLPEKKQTLLFSATMPDEVSRYARRHMKAPEQISLSRDQVSVSDIHHAYYIVSGVARSRDLLKILYAEEPESAIIFCNMRDETTMVAKYLQKQGLDAEPLSSDLSQADRERVMGRMKQKSLRYLCATDVAARGIDISNLSHVINFSVPESPEVYVHRTGRTGRAGKKGTALSMVGPRELGNFRYVRLQFGIKPEERLLPKDDIFEGKLKVPLPPVGTPQPPDPVQILIRGVQGTPSDLETSIFEKLYKTTAGKRVLAQLVAERLDKLSTRAKPKRDFTPRPEAERVDAPAFGDRPERTERPEGGERPFGDRDRPRFRDRDGGGERGDRPRFRDRDGGGERGDRPFGDRGPRGDGERGDRPFDRDRGPRGDRSFGSDRPQGERPAGDAPQGERPAGDRPERTDRPERSFDRERGGRDGRERFGGRDRDRGPRGDRFENRDERPADAAAPDAAAPVAAAPDAAIGAPVAERTERSDRHESRDRGDRGGRDGGGDRDRGRERRDWRERGDRDRGPRRDEQRTDAVNGSNGANGAAAAVNADGDEPTLRLPTTEVSEVGTEAAPVVETETTARVDDVARAALQRADRGSDRGDRGGDRKRGNRDRGGDRPERSAAPKADAPAGAASEQREFWETWAEEKSTRPAPAPAPAAAAASDDAAPASDAGERGGRGRGRDRSRGGDKPSRDAKPAREERAPRGRGGDKADAKPESAPAAAEPAAKSEGRGARTKRDTVVTAPAAASAATGDQARLFVNLGKKHGVSADDLRGLLAAAVGGDKASIGSVSLRDAHAHVRVPEDLADKIIAGVHGTQHNDQDITVERARA